MKRILAIIFAGFLMIVSGAGMASATQDSDDDGHKVGLCHRTASDSNPYVYIEVDEAAVPTHLHNGPGHPSKTNSDGSARDDYLANSESDCEHSTPCPTVTVTNNVPGPTVTETVEVPGPETTVTVTEPGPTVTETVEVPGPTVTETIPGPETTITETEQVEVPGPTVTDIRTVTIIKHDDGTTTTKTANPIDELPHTGGSNLLPMLLIALGFITIGTAGILATRHTGRH